MRTLFTLINLYMQGKKSQLIYDMRILQSHVLFFNLQERAKGRAGTVTGEATHFWVPTPWLGNTGVRHTAHLACERSPLHMGFLSAQHQVRATINLHVQAQCFPSQKNEKKWYMSYVRPWWFKAYAPVCVHSSNRFPVYFKTNSALHVQPPSPSTEMNGKSPCFCRLLRFTLKKAMQDFRLVAHKWLQREREKGNWHPHEAWPEWLASELAWETRIQQPRYSA